jgi:methyl-accepting chemotaxis protein
MAASTSNITSAQEEQHSIIDNINERIQDLNKTAHQLELTVNSFKV